MRHLFALFLAITFLSASVARAQSAPQAAAGLTVIRAGTLIDGTSAAPRKNQLIFVRGDRIEKVADGSAAIPADAKVIEMRGEHDVFVLKLWVRTRQNRHYVWRFHIGAFDPHFGFQLGIERKPWQRLAILRHRQDFFCLVPGPL